MFTGEDISEANSRVKTGADFPKLARELAEVGVLFNDFYVADGHAEYLGRDDHIVRTPAIRPVQTVAEKCDGDLFASRLKLHQSGETDFPAFLEDCAVTGVYKWRIDFSAMTCTYFDLEDNAVLIEDITQSG